MIDFSAETLIAISEVSKKLPGNPSIASIYRWMLKGIKGVRLETILVGGKRFSSAQALQRFVEKTTAAAAGEPRPIRTFKQRNRDREKAVNELEAEGLILKKTSSK